MAPGYLRADRAGRQPHTRVHELVNVSMRKYLPLLTLLALTLVGCGDESAVPPEVRAERELALRQSCVARVLSVRADEDLELLEETLGGYDAEDPFGQIGIRATQAALGFARAYQAHAELRQTAYASLDSAINRAPTPADSLRFLQRAQSISIRPPAPGTVEANVFTSYAANFQDLLQDEDHPCNWDF
jgi:hypothetical protein